MTSTSGGMLVDGRQQTLNGIDVRGMAPKVWLRKDGTVDRVVGIAGIRLDLQLLEDGLPDAVG